MKYSFVLLVLAMLANPATAQNFSIKWWKIAGGGGTSTNSQFTVTGIMGQPEVGPQMSDGEYSLGGGFWNLFATVPTVGALVLSLQVTANNTFTISWPSPSPGFSLEVTSDLDSTDWTPAEEPIQDKGTTKFIIINPGPGIRFYRLRNPQR